MEGWRVGALQLLEGSKAERGELCISLSGLRAQHCQVSNCAKFVIKLVKSG